MQTSSCFLHGFHSILPLIEKPQDSALDWLARAHALAQGRTDPSQKPNGSDPNALEKMRMLFSRFGCSPSRIETRYSALEDFRHCNFDEMLIFQISRNPRGSTASARTKFFARVAGEAFEKFYAEEAHAPNALLHVTCTGYDAPSAAERLVARKGWGSSTEVYHVYHMGCYAAVPATRLAQSILCTMDRTQSASIDIVHTELCSIHLDPSRHSPEQMVIQSLFSDGLIRYSVSDRIRHPGLQLLATRKEILPSSESAMTWSVGDHGMEMTLSREVPGLIVKHLEPLIEKLKLLGGIGRGKLTPPPHFAIHPGGPRIIDQVQELLKIPDSSVAISRQVLKDRGNMSSATLPHIWMKIIEDESIPVGTPILSLAFGPGLTICGNILKKVSP